MMNIHMTESNHIARKVVYCRIRTPIGVGRNSLSTSLRKQSAISHEVIIKIFEHFLNIL